jgi:hypothetical protein
MCAKCGCGKKRGEKGYGMGKAGAAMKGAVKKVVKKATAKKGK